MLLAATLVLSGCGNTYRPVISAFSPVGPASQPYKYAAAVSNPSGVPYTVTGYSITSNVITVTLSAAAPNPFSAGESVTFSGFPTSTFLNGQTVTVLSTGLTTTQFQANFVHANATATETGTVAPTEQGLVTFVDFSGDTVVSTPSIMTNPSYFAQNNSGNQGYVINATGSLDTFALTNPSALLTSDITQTTLSSNSNPVTISIVTPSNGASAVFVPESSGSKIAILSGNGSPALLQELAVAANPVYVVGADQTPRVYALSQGTGGNGVVSAIEAVSATSLSVSATIPVGVKPVYGVMTSDDRRAFILNQGSGTVSVVNVLNNALDSTTPTITLPNVVYTGGTSAPNPIWADLAPITSELVVLNQGDGTHPGSLSIISIPLCSVNTQVTNPNCNLANPVDATGFGQIIASPNVGINPQMVSVLKDGTRAYVVNQRDSTGTCNAGEGSVTVVSLVSGLVSSTICGVSTLAGTTGANAIPGAVYGHPNTVAATTGTPTGKVYVTAPDSQYMTIIYTDTDTVQTHIPLQGLGLRVLVTQP
jgi:hypothetical protein